MALSTKDIQFCEEYVCNGYQAAAAYSKFYPSANYDSAKSGACRKLKRQEVRDYIAQFQKEIYEAKCITAERIADELAYLAFERDGEKVAHINKLKAIDLLQKQMGLQQKKIDADVNGEINISISIGDEED